jgi:hypothetical protein
MQQKTGTYLALAALLFIGGIETRASERSETRVTILVYDYVGIGNETLFRAEAEADLILRHASVEVAWRQCYAAANPPEAECPNIGPSTPALRLMPHFRLVPNQVRADTLGFSVGNMMSVSYEQAERIAGSGAGPITETLAVTIAHEFGHLHLRNAHSVSGIMRARLDQRDWELADKGWLSFHPVQAAKLRKELRTRSEILLAACNTP